MFSDGKDLMKSARGARIVINFVKGVKELNDVRLGVDRMDIYWDLRFCRRSRRNVGVFWRVRGFNANRFR
jgi:hypothetical protein